MKFAAVFLWLAAWLANAPRAILTDDVYQIPAHEWRFVEFVLKQRPVAVECSFQVVSGGPGVRLELIAKGDLRQFLFSKPHESLASTGYETKGELRLPVQSPGEYAIVIASSPQARAPASVHLHLALDFSGSTGVTAGYLSPRRRWTVVAISFAAFFAIAIVSGRKLLRAVRRS
ncbi:MAG: hypothetical protein ACR2I2_20500 [Bryobacteraceae bacterium]